MSRHGPVGGGMSLRVRFQRPMSGLETILFSIFLCLALSVSVFVSLSLFLATSCES